MTENPKTRPAATSLELTRAYRGPGDSVHNHRPLVPGCRERLLADGEIRGACLTDDGTPRTFS